eukprot:6180213-Pleurochrysis_carterae.AAC.5
MDARHLVAARLRDGAGGAAEHAAERLLERADRWRGGAADALHPVARQSGERGEGGAGSNRTVALRTHAKGDGLRVVSRTKQTQRCLLCSSALACMRWAESTQRPRICCEVHLF